MEVPLQITLRDIARSDALSERIRAGAARLERKHPDITSCRVVIQEDGRRHRQGRQYSVHVEVRLPGRDAFVSTLTNEDAYVALRDAFDATQKQLG